MRRIYLVRHGEPYFPDGDRYCLGAADFPLSTLGRLQACQTGQALENKCRKVFTSPLKRAQDTAKFIAPSPTVIQDLQEMHAGDWDGLSFTEIEKKWPELFKARATNTQLPIPNSEDWEAGQARFIKAVEAALENSEGDIAIVAHTTVILSLICHIMGDREYSKFRYRQGYGGYYIVTLDGSGLMRCEFPWQRPEVEPDEDFCLRLLEAAALPEATIAHCKAVAETGLELCGALDKAGLELEHRAVYRAALLHDIARSEKNHPAVGAAWLHELGYGEIADIVRQHHGPESRCIDEAAVLFIADKLVQGTKRVELKERFEKSRAKCKSPEALAAHARREEMAEKIKAEINRLCGGEIIK